MGPGDPYGWPQLEVAQAKDVLDPETRAQQDAVS
jgi:hypothetical protein